MSGTNDASRPKWHAIGPSASLVALNTDGVRGLSSEEAKSRLGVYGPNIIRSEERPSLLRILGKQFANMLIAILLIATVISGILGNIIDAVVILVIVFFSVFLGFLQEFRAERALQALKKMLSPTCTVVRDGARNEIPAEELVPGDILLLDSGERVDADGRLVEAFNLELNEASLTGESVPVMKSTAKLDEAAVVAERLNMVYAGTTVAQGRGKAVVVSTGTQTEFGKIAVQVATTKSEESPLERRMGEIGVKLGRVCLLLVTVIAIGGLVEEYSKTGAVGLDFVIRIFLFAVALAVAAVPEALPAIVTGSLAIGMRIMASRNALIRSMPAVETLGSTQVICSDKTGTLTKGEMTVREIVVSGKLYEITGSGYEPKGEIHLKGEPSALSAISPHEDLQRFARAAVLCSDAMLVEQDNHWVVKGDSTEGALVVLAEKVEARPNETRNAHQRIGELPFTSERKRLTTINSGPGGTTGAYMKGAPEAILSFCTSFLDDGRVRVLIESEKERVLKLNEEMAQRALRVLAVAERPLTKVPEELTEKTIESGFIFLGLAGITDPPRQDAIEAVKAAKQVGMTVVMITGDHKLTALAVAEEAGIYEDGDLAITGEELDKLTDTELEEKVEKISVYARVSPSHKLRIVDAWKKKGKVVAMTGDGVNDAPALKKADIGIAMGITGTDVTKEASDVVLADDNFATIIKAIELGRWIYDNIKKYLAYLLQTNFVEIAVMTLISLLLLPLVGIYGANALPLLASQLLYINLATDGLPAIALGLGPPDPDLMKKPPRPKDEFVFTKDVTRLIVMALIVQTPFLILGFMTGLGEGLVAARSRLFLIFIGMELAVSLNCQSLTHSFFKVKPHHWLVLAVLSEIALITILGAVPLTRSALGIVFPSVTDMVWIIAGALEAVVSIELLKRYVKPRIVAAQSAAS